MSRRPIKVGITGTHSTGKSTFVAALGSAIGTHGLKVGYVSNLAKRAVDIGFPILSGHTFESTLWIMAECMKQEAEASLSKDVILVDRPVPDALGYFYAALEVTGRVEDAARLDRLKVISRACAADYDLLVVTALDRNIPIGEGRDNNQTLREAAARHIDQLMSEFAPNAMRLSSKNCSVLVETVSAFVLSRLSDKTN